MQRYIGKYTSGKRKAANQRTAQRDFEQSLPPAIKALMMRRDAAAAEKCSLIVNGTVTNRSRYIEVNAEYTSLVTQIAAAIRGI